MRPRASTTVLLVSAGLAVAACDPGSTASSTSSSASASTVSLSSSSGGPPRTPGVAATDSLSFSGAVTGQPALQDVHCGVPVPRRGPTLETVATLRGATYNVDVASMYGQVEVSVA